MNGTRQIEGQHLDAEALDRYRRRVAPAAELLAVDAHIASCDRCFGAVRAATEVIELPAANDHEHLTYEELESFVDNRADALDRELVTAHVALCTLCSDELVDLTATRDALAPRTPRAAERPRVVRRVP